MNGLKPHTATVICRKDGKPRLFLYYAARNADGSVRFGLRYGCGDKSPGCAKCIRCWNGVRQAISSRESPHVP